ncbi:MAG: murein L,D-transpeptidase catalytic domain-containing protein, partial [Tannerellaceae bacterium]
SVIGGSGRLRRSLGCPALPPSINKPVIDAIKNGSVLFIYGNDESYTKKSPILSSRDMTLEAKLK